MAMILSRRAAIQAACSSFAFRPISGLPAIRTSCGNHRTETEIEVQHAAFGSARGEFSDQMVDDACHCHGRTEVEFVDGDEGANPARRRESRVAEYTL